MGKLKISKISRGRAIRLWCIVLPLLLLLLVFLRYPLRIETGEIDYDIQFYGAITLISGLCALTLARKYRHSASRLAIALFICALLSGWQVFDLMILRAGFYGYLFWPDGAGYDLPINQGISMFHARFSNEEPPICHGITEIYYGNSHFAITIEMNRYAAIYDCGG